MRKFVVAPLLLAPLLLAGCGNQSANSGSSASSAAAPNRMSQAATPAPTATAVSGTVSLAPNTGVKVTPQAKLQLSLVDVSQQPSVTVNQANISPAQFPQKFHIPFSSSAIHTNDIYVLQAQLKDNGREWTTKLNQPVLTQGQPAHANITLVPVPTHAEKVLAAFQKAKRQTGGMKVKNGSSSKIGEASSWQVFRDLHGVEFIILQKTVNKKHNKSFTRTQFAYQNKLPWVVVKQIMPSQKAQPTSTTRVGWGDDGKVVLNQHEQHGKTGTISNKEADALHKEAEAQYKRFSKKH
jgi:putative lipoprotein